MRNITFIVFAFIFTLLGLGGGYYATKPRAVAEPAKPAEPGAPSEPAGPKLSPQALKNLGVSIAPAETSSYSKYRAVPAVVAEAPATKFTLVAPVSGRIESVTVKPETVVPAGFIAVTILRDPLPRPVLSLTEESIKSANEELHRAAGDLRKASRNVEIARSEFERLKKFTQVTDTDSLPLIPKKNLIELEYEQKRAEQDVQNARVELRQHGFTDAQLADVEAGKPLAVLGPKLWKQALERNGLWTTAADELLGALPEQIRELPINVAVCGELAAAGLSTGELAKWLKGEKSAAANFQAIAGLLQQGHSLLAIQRLHANGGFAPLVAVSTPPAQVAEDWDAHELLVKAGERVEAGAKLLTLENPRRMMLKSEPMGGETSAIVNAFQADTEIEAAPLVDMCGASLKKLHIAHIEGEDQSSGVVAFIRVQNEPMRTSDEPGFGKTRSWKLRKGQKYTLRIPSEKFDNAFVFPADAVTDDGVEKVVFIQDGNSFKPLKVELLYQDHETAVIANNKDTEIFPGDKVVIHNAFGLALALKASAGEPAGEGEAGHHHHHHH